MARKISILNFKGGVGKTTFTINTSDALARRGKNVLVVDCDMQGNASTLIPDIQEPTLTHVLRGQAKLTDAIQKARENLWVIPADPNLNKAGNYIVSEGRTAYYSLRKAINQLTGFDYIFFDHSPNYTPVSETALLASSEMLIPTELSPFSIEGLLNMFDKLNESLVEHELDMTGIIPMKLNRSISMHNVYMKDLEKEFSDQILPAVRTDAAIGKSQSYHLSIFEYDEQEKTHSKAAEDFNVLADLLIGAA